MGKRASDGTGGFAVGPGALSVVFKGSAIAFGDLVYSLPRPSYGAERGLERLDRGTIELRGMVENARILRGKKTQARTAGSKGWLGVL